MYFFLHNKLKYVWEKLSLGLIDNSILLSMPQTSKYLGTVNNHLSYDLEILFMQ